MDQERFEELVRSVNAAGTRREAVQRFVGGALASALAVFGLADADAEAKGKKGNGKGKKGHDKGKKNDRREKQRDRKRDRNRNDRSDNDKGRDKPASGRQGGQTCNPSQASLCHCEPPSDPHQCQVLCTAGLGGHSGHAFDCICGPTQGGIPTCSDLARCSNEGKAPCCPQCPPELPTCCIENGAGGCFNLNNDPAHCGSCTNACPSGQTCSNGTCVGGCTPTTCAAQGKNCGSISDGCGGTLNCGDCTAPQTCGGGGTPNVCGCTPATSCPAGQNCGTAPDGCGGTLRCGTCPAGQTCTEGTCTGCAFASCTIGYYSQNNTCGTWTDGPFPTCPTDSPVGSRCGSRYPKLSDALKARGANVICAQAAAAILNVGLGCFSLTSNQICSQTNEQLSAANESGTCPLRGCGNGRPPRSNNKPSRKENKQT